ncbi:hypothetical protein PMAYCL1PPCAC_03199, partial [Pristionchus mayeri]
SRTSEMPTGQRPSLFNFLRRKKRNTTPDPRPRAEEEVRRAGASQTSKETPQKPKKSTPKREATPHRGPPPAVGIDLGTTFSAIAYIDRGTPIAIKNNACHEITPSVVHFGERVLVGEDAVMQRKDASRNTIYNIKRIIGRRHDDPMIRQLALPFEIVKGTDDRAVVRVGDQMNTPEQINAHILQYMRSIAKNVLFDEPTEAVITVPANFTNAQREATKEAGRLAGLNVLQIVNEPTAAALAFSVQCREDNRMRRVLVFDLGGGTLDASLVEIEGLTTKVLASEGLTTLGGSDFDQRIYDHAIGEFRRMKINITGVDWTLMEACENAKKALSKRKETRLIHKHHGGNGFNLSRDTFNDLCMDLFEKALRVVDDVLHQANLDEGQIDEILLVGGSTRMPQIREMLAERFPDKNIRDDIEPDLAVAKGAAILAASLTHRASEVEEEDSSSDDDSTSSSSSSGDSFTLVNLLDVAPLHLGLRLDGDTCKILIPKNTPIPIAAYEFCTNANDDDLSLDIEILEGNDAQASNNATLSKVEIEVSPKPAGRNHIKVVLSIDSSGILSVSAVDMHTNKEVSVTFRSNAMDEELAMGQNRRNLERQRDQMMEQRDQMLEALAALLRIRALINSDSDNDD